MDNCIISTEVHFRQHPVILLIFWSENGIRDARFQLNCDWQESSVSRRIKQCHGIRTMDQLIRIQLSISSHAKCRFRVIDYVDPSILQTKNIYTEHVIGSTVLLRQ